MGSHLVTRPWHAGDLQRLRSAESLFSTGTLSRRFHTGTRSLPPSYVKSLMRPSLRQSAVHRGQIVGLAECVRPPGGGPPDMAIMIADEWQGRGVGRRLVLGLVRRCIDAGVRHIEAETEAENAAALALVRSVTRPGVLPGCWLVQSSSMAAYRHLVFTYCG
ncbi:GNAT family N-acetyltransferase [Actinoplanes sp. TBRC 11911]|nr:GNAT family N-acetyltransferase [Actinoplanes sp. TBRC 11911]